MRDVLRGSDVVVARTFNHAQTLSTDASWRAALVDVSLGVRSGFNVLDALRRHDEDLPALVFSEQHEPGAANLAFERHASHLTKPVSARHVHEFLERNPGKLRTPDAERPSRISIDEVAVLELVDIWRERHHLTTTEAEVLHLAMQGLSRPEIAKRRGVAETTIKTHVARLLSKTSYATISQLVYDAMHELFFVGTGRANLGEGGP